MANELNIVFAGTPDFARVHLEALVAARHKVCAVLTQPDRKAGRGKKLTPSPVKVAAQAANIPVFQPLSLKGNEEQAWLRAQAPDVLIVVAYGLILPQAVLDIPRYGCLNVHASRLPRWRGAAPIQRAIEAGDAVTGVTIMQMEAGLDTGPMLLEVDVPIAADDTGGSLHDKLAEAGPDALLKVLDDLPDFLTKAKIQDDALATYAHKITKSDGQINWRDPATSLSNRIRAFVPTSACFSHLGNERVKLWQASASPEQSGAEPGTIVNIDKAGITVACSEGCLIIETAQFPGGKPLPVAALLNGKAGRLQPGQCFTQSPSPEAGQ